MIRLINISLVLFCMPIIMLAENKLLLEILPNGPEPLEWEESITFEIHFTDQNGLSRQARISIKDDLTGNEIEENSMRSGYHEYKTTVPFGIDNGVYTLYITAEKDDFESAYDTVEIEVIHDYIQIESDVRPAAKFVLDWGEIIEYSIDVLDINNEVLENADVAIYNELDNSEMNLLTDIEGHTEYKVVVPNNLPDSTYNITFLISKFGYTSTDEIKRRIQVRHVNLVEYIQSSEINVYPQPATDYINILLPDNFVKIGFKLIDIYGQTLPFDNINCEKNVNSYKLRVDGLSSGLYFLLIESRLGTVLKKIIITE